MGDICKSGVNDSGRDSCNGGWTVEVQKKSSSSRGFRKNLCGLKTAAFSWFRGELLTQFKLSFPIILSLIFQNLLLFVSLIFVGHISGKSLELNSAALATSFVNVTGISIGVGLTSAADTLCSQTYGFKNYKRVGHIFQQGVLILLVLCFFVWPIWLNTESLLLLWQQPPCVARYSGYYTQIYTLFLPPFFVYWMLQKYLQAQSIVWPFILTGFIGNVANAIFHAIFIFGLGLGVNGASVSIVLANFIQPVVLIIYIRVRKLHSLTWGGWSWESLNDWWPFLKLGIPGMAMICLEWVSYEIAVFVLGSIGEVELALNSILVNILVVAFMIPLGISITGGVRVGNELGAGNPRQAKRAAYVSIGIVACNAIVQIIFLHSVKNVIGTLYTEDEEVLAKFPKLINIVTPGFFFDQVQLVIQGLLRGCGLQTQGAIINFFAFYFLGIPLGISLALFVHMGTYGVWIGLACATTSQCIIYFIIILRMNWKKQSEKAMERASRGLKKEETSEISEEENCDETSLGLDDISEQCEAKPLILPELNEETSYHRDVDMNTTDENKLEEQKEENKNKEDVEEDGLLQDMQEISLLESFSPPPKSINRSSHIRLLFTKGSLFVIGTILVILAGFASQYHPPDSIINGNFTECTSHDEFNSDVFSSFTTVILITPSPTPYEF